MSLSTTALYAAVNVLLNLALAGNISRIRLREGIGLGDGGNRQLQRAIRAHGNNSEWLPLALVMLLVVELLGAPSLQLHVLGGTLTLGRLLHAGGMYTLWPPLKVVASTINYLLHAALAAYALWLRPWG